MELPKAAFKPVAGGALVTLRVQPGASRSRLVGGYGDAVKVALQAPPVDGRANEELVRQFALWCGVPKGKLTIRSGLSGRSKVLEVAGFSPDELCNLLENLP